MAEAVLFLLPSIPDRGHRETHWWHVADGEIVGSGASGEWVALAASGERKRVALAPAGSVRVSLAEPTSGAATARQAAAIARVAAIEESLGDDEALHAVSGAANGGPVMTAVVDNGVMLAWLDWATELGVDPHQVVPLGALLPLSDSWVAASFGSEHLVARGGVVMPFEPELASWVIGDEQVATLGEAEQRLALVRAAEAPPLDLRAGRFARRRRISLDRARIRELVLLAALIPLITLAWALVVIARMDRETDRLNAETLTIAEATLGRPVALESAESELAQRIGGSAYGGLMAPLTALYDALQAEQSVSTTDVSYRGDGTLSATLAAPTIDAVNRVLIALQRNGYRVTAVSRQSPDGRAMVDTTVRSGP